MMPLLLHLRRSFFVVVAPVLGLLGFAVAWSGSSPIVVTHGDLTANVVAASSLLAPLLSGFAAWDGLRELRHHGAPILDSAAQSRARIVLLQALAGLIFTAVVFLIMVMALYWRATWFVLTGPILVIPLLVSFVVLCVATLIGYATAALVRHWVAVAIAPLPALALYSAGLFRAPSVLLASLVPFGNRTGIEFLDPNPWFFVSQLLVFIGLVVLIVAIVALMSRRDRWAGVLASVVAVSFVAGGVIGLDRQQGRWGIPVSNVRAQLHAFTTNDGNLTLDIPPYYAPVVDELLATWSRAQILLSSTPLAFHELAYVTDSHPVKKKAIGLTNIYLGPYSRSPGPDSVMSSLPDVIPFDCGAENIVVAWWIAGQGAESSSQLMDKTRDDLRALRALTPKEGSAWLGQHFPEIEECRLTPDDFPN